jgi:ABC-2 type transport system permease protein
MNTTETIFNLTGIKPRRVLAQIFKEIAQLTRDRLTLALALVLPLILLLVLSFAVSLDVHSVSLAIQDLDRTAASREYIATFERTNRFKVIDQGPSVNVQKLLDQGLASAGIVIPQNFSDNLSHRDRSSQVQILVDGTDANTADIVQGYAEATSDAFSRGGSSNNATAVEVQSRFWFNPGLESLTYIGPGAVAITLTLFPPLLAGLATVREREQGTIVQVYASSLTGAEYLLGKAIAFGMVGIVEAFLIILEGFFLLGLRFVGDPVPFLIGLFFYIACGVFWGIFVGCFAESQGVVIEVVDITTFLVSLLMAGDTYPVENIPIALRWISSFVPARHFVSLSRDAFVRGVGWSSSWGAVLSLGLLMSFFLLIAWQELRKMQLEG